MNTKSARPVVLDVAVPSEDLSYPVIVGAGMLARVGSELRKACPRATRVAVVSDENVMPLYGDLVRAALGAEDFEVVSRVVPAGEGSKSPDRLLWLVGELITAGLSRTDALVALGGGVVGDLGGMVAAVFMRGIPYVQVPTSLLAQVDSSVGGKVAIDMPQGKNLLGAFHFPRLVLIDPSVLSTLPDVEIGCGLAEMYKHGLLFSRDHVEVLLRDADAFYARDEAAIAPLVATSVALKAACVSRDPLEKSVAGKGRVLLNLGHTIGHAIEAAADYSLKHGQAVGIGLRAAARLSHAKGLAPANLEPRIAESLGRLRLPNDLDGWLKGPAAGLVQQALRHDKKREHDTLTYIALAEVGDPRVVTTTVDEILDLLRA